MPTPPPDQPDRSFDDFALDPKILEAVKLLGFDKPTPIQSEAMPPMLEGRDMIGRARTGSGKTAAFGLPLLERVKDGGPTVRAMVLAPTRELALQVTEALRTYAKRLPVRLVTVYGGAPYGPQLKALKKGVAVVVGTPGRVLDYLERGALDLSKLEILVLDEADEMLRMGFIDDVERVLAASPESKQVVLFSASMPEQIKRVANKHLKNPLQIQVESSALTVSHIEQRWVHVPQQYKLEALTRILRVEPPGASLIFCRTRAGCAEAADLLAKRGVPVDALHGDLNQAARERVLGRLRSRRLDVVIATDVAARGIDVEHLLRVINFDLPTDKETYVHRIGRTGRAGRKGLAISFVTPKERAKLNWFERSLKVEIAQMQVPSDSDIQAAQVDWIKQTVMEGEATPALSGIVDKLVEGGADARDIATRAIQILAKSNAIHIEESPDTRPPVWSRPPQHKGRSKGGEGGGHAPTSGDEVELFFPVGKSRGVRPADLVGALANEAGVPGSSIGRITVVPFKSFVALPREAAEHVVESFSELTVRGRPVRVSIARPRVGGGPPPRRDGGDRRPFKRRGKPPGPAARPSKGRWKKKGPTGRGK